jgi:crossover junction endodeoxyribonuclease RuvC
LTRVHRRPYAFFAGVLDDLFVVTRDHRGSYPASFRPQPTDPRQQAPYMLGARCERPLLGPSVAPCLEPHPVSRGMDILGFDLSLTATGVAYPDGRALISSRLKGMARLDELERLLLNLAKLAEDPLVVIEGYSFGQGRGIQNHALGELGGVVRLGLYRAGIPYVDVPPASLKKFATGKGNANKDEMLAVAIRRWGYEGSNNNEADAHLLRVMGLAAYSDVEHQVPQYAMEALAKVEWPEREEAGAT